MGIIQAWVGPSPVNNPNQLPNISLWYSATDGSAAQFSSLLTNGQVVTTWVDLTGSGHDANKAGSSTVKPVWLANQQNGKGVVDFTSADTDSLDINPINWARSLSGITVYVVAKADSLSGVTPIIGSDITNGIGIQYNGSNWTTSVAGGLASATSLSGDTTNYHIFGIVYDGTISTATNRISFRYDSIPQTLTYPGATPGTTTSASLGYLYIGTNTGKVNYFDGAIGDVMIFTRALGVAECLQVEAYLKTIWNTP